MSPDNKFHKDEISQLISKGRKQGYLLFEEIDKTFTEDLDSEEDFDDFLSSMDDYGIKILDSRQKEMHPPAAQERPRLDPRAWSGRPTRSSSTCARWATSPC